MDYVLAPFLWLIGVLVSIILWIVTQVLWILLWLVLPLAVVAFVALRITERALGQEKVRAWVRVRTRKYGSAVSKRVQRWIFALGVVPVRALCRLAQRRQLVMATAVVAMAARVGEAVAAATAVTDEKLSRTGKIESVSRTHRHCCLNRASRFPSTQSVRPLPRPSRSLSPY